MTEKHKHLFGSCWVEFTAESLKGLEVKNIQEIIRSAQEAIRLYYSDNPPEQSKEHKRNVNNTAVLDFVAAGLTEPQAILSVKAIASGKVSNIIIKY